MSPAAEFVRAFPAESVPQIAAVTPGWWVTQATASWAVVTPSRSATAPSRSTRGTASASRSGGNSPRRQSFSGNVKSAGYRPVRIPDAIGEYAR